MKHRFPIIAFFVLFFSLTACAKEENVPFIPSYPNDSTLTEKYTQADASQAMTAFNAAFLDPERKLYYRNTNKTHELGAIWTQAIYWDMVMNAYKRTKSPKYLQMIEDIYQGGYKEYDAYNWDNGSVWFIYDDIMWWTISMGRAYEITKDEKYLKLAKSSFKRVWYGSTVVGDRGSYDPAVGGMEWAWTQAGKTACINYPTVIGAMNLYNITKDTSYLNKAIKIYSWARKNLFDAQGKVADHKVGNNPANFNSLHTYNQATCIGAAVMLYKATNTKFYLDDAVLAANYTKNTMSNANGILPYEGDYSDINNEQGIYNAILAQYIVRLIEDCDKPEYLPWLRTNIDTGWQNRDTKRDLTTKDFKKSCTSDMLITCYDAASIVSLMQVCPPDTTKK